MAALSNPDVPYPPNAPDGPPYHMWPIRRIIQVGWANLPVYVSVYVSADRTGLSSGSAPNHTATVTLTQAAIDKGCEIVLATRQQVGSPYKAMFGLTVIKVPRLVKGKLFTLTLAGMTHALAGPAPDDYFCGTYESHSDTVRGADAPTTEDDRFRVATYTFTWSWSNPSTSDSGSNTFAYFYNLDDPASVAQAESFVHNTTESYEYLSYYNGSTLVNTGRPCDDPVDDTTHFALFPFNTVQVTVNPIKNHTVAVADIPFIEPSECVRTAGQTGDATSIWEIFLKRQEQPFISDGLYDGSYDFSMQISKFAASRKEKIIEIWPSNAFSPTVRYDQFGPGFRLNKSVPTGSMYRGNWDGTPPSYSNEIRLFSGAPPTIAPYIPDGIPF